MAALRDKVAQQAPAEALVEKEKKISCNARQMLAQKKARSEVYVRTIENWRPEIEIRA